MEDDQKRPEAERAISQLSHGGRVEDCEQYRERVRELETAIVGLAMGGEMNERRELLVAIARCEGDPNDAYELMGKLAALLGFDLDDAVAEAEAAEVDN